MLAWCNWYDNGVICLRSPIKTERAGFGLLVPKPLFFPIQLIVRFHGIIKHCSLLEKFSVLIVEKGGDNGRVVRSGLK